MTLPTTRQLLQGWGRSTGATADVWRPNDAAELGSSSFGPRRSGAGSIPRGLGRSYGDAAHVADGLVIDTLGCRDVAWVDRNRGVVRAQAGVSIGDLIDRFVPKGWFVPVTPGTRLVTVGGAIAADIHGKNHHVDGSFGDYVERLTLRLASDDVVTVSPTEESTLFWATVGGMGLTGLIVDADIRLQPIPTSTVTVETSRHRTLDELTSLMLASDDEHVFSVAWVDLVDGGRSVLTQGSFSAVEELDAPPQAGPHRRPRLRTVGLPPMPPMRFVVGPAMRVFNEAWWRRAPAEPAISLESITAFFHPLDAVRDWNRLYGPKGFLQWQCVVPDDATDALGEICAAFRRLPASLTVLKRLGPQNAAPLSFPMSGWTLAVDLAAEPQVYDALSRLDALTVEAGGRLYLAKDARMSRETLEAGYPRLDEWKQVRTAVDPLRRWRSDLADRLGL